MKKTLGILFLFLLPSVAVSGAEAIPGVPTNLRADISVGTTGQLFVSWYNEDSAAYYNLQSSQSPDSGFSDVAICSGLSGNAYTQSPNVLRTCRDNKLTVNATYYYKVQACNSDGQCSDFSSAISNSPVSSNCTKAQIPNLQGLRPPKYVKVLTSDVDHNAVFDKDLYEYAGYPTVGVTRQNRLLVKLPGSDETCDMEGISTAENLGFDVLCVNFDNAGEQRVICQSDPTCFGNISQAKLNATGICTKPDQSHCGIDPKTQKPYFMNNPSDAVTKRITTMLQYLVKNGYNGYGTNWGDYLSGGEPNWSKLVIGGHSQGGDLGTYASYQHVVARVFNLSAPPQTSTINGAQVAATYMSDPQATDVRSIYGFVSINDPLYGMGVYASVWQAMGLTSVNHDAEVKLNTSKPIGLNCNSGTPSHNFSTSALISHPGAGHADPLAEWNEDVWKFMLLD